MQPNAQFADWCIDDDTGDSIIARRNVLAGLWAAQLMRLPEQAAQAYAAEVHLADHRPSGDDALVSKLCADLNKSGLVATPHMVRTKLLELNREAAAENAATE
jgi:hypothetical protein